MALYMIGIGLCDEKDITLKGLEAIRNSEKVYLETYTSTLQVAIKDLEKFYEKDIIPADRNLVENKAEETILKDSKVSDVSFLVIGDIFGATTHTDLYLRAKKDDIEVRLIHNASVLNAVSDSGLELYKFGKVTSIPFENNEINTPAEVLNANETNGLHTLFLLDLDPKNNRYMRTDKAIRYLISKGIKPDKKAVICAGLGSSKKKIIYSSLGALKHTKIDIVPQCLIIPGKMHFMEEDFLNIYKQA